MSQKALEFKSDIIIGKNFNVHSDILKENRGISIGLPAHYEETKEKYDVLFVLDGYFNAAYGVADFLSMEAEKAPPLIVVTIHNTDRMRDMSPTNSLISWDGKAYDEFKSSGGADNFLNFIGLELLPIINWGYRTTGSNILAGHSLSGLTVLYALQNYAHLFDGYISVDPSYWWDNELILKEENIAKLNNLKTPKKLYFNLSQHHPDNLMEEKGSGIFLRILKRKAFKNLNYNYSHLKKESHDSMVLKSIYEALEFIYKK